MCGVECPVVVLPAVTTLSHVVSSTSVLVLVVVVVVVVVVAVAIGFVLFCFVLFFFFLCVSYPDSYTHEHG